MSSWATAKSLEHTLQETLPAGTIINDRYVIECTLGKGAMAMVYRVRHIHLNTLHALKLLMMPSLAIQQRLMQEGRVQASLRHTNVVSVTDVADVDGTPALVMEYIEGPSLDELLKQHSISVEQAVALGAGIIQGVAAAHDHGLIHRDLKPANVMLAVKGGALVPKVTDFGLAKLLDGDALSDMTATRSGIAMGTPAYMAPEQFRDAKTVDARADIFSIGAMLFELACGERAFKGDNFLDVYQSVSDGNFKSPKLLNPDLPDSMVEAIVGALNVDRDARIPDCLALLSLWSGTSSSSVLAKPQNIVIPKGPWDANLMSKVSTLSSKHNINPTPIKESSASRPKQPAATWNVASSATPPPYGSASDTMVLDIVKDETPTLEMPVVSKKNTAVIMGFALLVIIALSIGALFGLGLFESASEAAQDIVAQELGKETAPPATKEASQSDDLVSKIAVKHNEPVISNPAQPSVPTVKRVETSVRKNVVAPPKSAPKRDTLIEAVLKVKTPVESEAPPEASSVIKVSTDTPPPSNTAKVEIKGDAQRVWFANTAGNFDPGTLNPGTYKILVLFQAGKTPLQVGEISVKAGEQRTVTCRSMFSKCQIQ